MSKKDLDDLLQLTIKKDGEYQRQLIECIDLKNKEIERLNTIINKAIKYIKKTPRRGLFFDIYLPKVIAKELLDILKGVDKE